MISAPPTPAKRRRPTLSAIDGVTVFRRERREVGTFGNLKKGLGGYGPSFLLTPGGSLPSHFVILRAFSVLCGVFERNTSLRTAVPSFEAISVLRLFIPVREVCNARLRIRSTKHQLIADWRSCFFEGVVGQEIASASIFISYLAGFLYDIATTGLPSLALFDDLFFHWSEEEAKASLPMDEGTIGRQR